jgi:hypothetical protein
VNFNFVVYFFALISFSDLKLKKDSLIKEILQIKIDLPINNKGILLIFNRYFSTSILIIKKV